MWASAPVPAAEFEAASALYAAETAYDPFRVQELGRAAPELERLYAQLDERVPPQRIYSYSRDAPQGRPQVRTVGHFKAGTAEALLSDFIAQYEAGRGDYDAVWAGSRLPLPAVPTRMTLCQVLDWQERARKVQASTAIGRYQIVSGTLKGVVDDLGLACGVLFDAETQDQIALELFNRRGWSEFLAGRISVEDFAFELAGEWAAFPASKGADKGRSRYWRVGGNRHLVGLVDYLAFLRGLRSVGGESAATTRAGIAAGPLVRVVAFGAGG